nr:PREDICTED: uncharacterized protein LOC109035292 isoform X2 [Bemisia tabaci]
MQATWGQWGAQAATTGVASSMAGFSMPPPTTAASTASTAATGAAATQALGAFSMGSYPMYNAQAAALNPAAMTAATTGGAGVAAAAAGYTPQQWAMAQQQNWQQWEQWQQQYAQWQQQYGEKYQAHMNATMGVAPTPDATPKPPLPTTAPQQPPPPTAAAPSQPSTQYDSGSNKGTRSQADESLKRGFDDKDSKDDAKKFKSDKSVDDKAKKGESLEELAEAEKAFDQQFKNWESQFLRWKEQNINHPDKNQYKEYEAKWESWREQLLDRREQMKKRREAKEAQIKKEEEAAREAAAKEAKKNEAPAVSAAATMMSGMNSAAGSMNPAMFQMNAAMNPAAAMAGFGAYGFPGYGAFPGMAVPPPMTQQTTQAAMNQFPGMNAAAMNPETNTAPLDFLKSGSKGIPGLDLVGQEGDSGNRNDPSKNSQERNDYSGRDMNKPLTTSDDKPFQFPPPVGQMPPFMQGANQQVGMPPSFAPNVAPPAAGMFSAPPPDGFGMTPAAGAPNMYGMPNPMQMYPGMPNAGFTTAPPTAAPFNQNSSQGPNAFGGDKAKPGDSSNRFGRGQDSQSDNFRSQNNYFDSSGGKEKGPGGLLQKPAGFDQRGGGRFNRDFQDSSQYPDDDMDVQSNGSFNRSYDDQEYPDYNKFKSGPPGFDPKNKPPGFMDRSGPRDTGNKGFNQRKSRFDDPITDREPSKPSLGGSLNNAGSLLRPSYLMDKRDALERIRTSAGLPPLSSITDAPFGQSSAMNDFRSKGRGQFDNSRTREPFEERGQFDGPNSGDQFNEMDDRFDEPRGRGKFDEPRGRGRFDEPRGRGRFEARGRGRFDGSDRGFDSRNKFDTENKFPDDDFGPPRPFRDENLSPGNIPNSERPKWGRPEPAPTPAPSRFEPAPVRPRLEVEFLRPAKVIDYNHKRLEPDFFEPVTIQDYGHGIANYSSRSSVYDKGIRRSEYEDKMPRSRHSRSPVRRSPPRRMSPSRRSPGRRFSPSRSSRENPSRSPIRRKSPSTDRGGKKFEEKDSERDSNKNSEPQTDSSKQQGESSAPSSASTGPKQQSVSISDLLEPPGRNNRPTKIVIILRGPPGSGKSYVAKLIKDKEVAMGGTAPRILSLDDYFLTEVEKEEVDPDTNKKVTTKKMEYVYEAGMEKTYLLSLVKAFRKTVTEGFFNFIIVDSVFDKIAQYGEIVGHSKTNGFKPYICEMDLDVAQCLKRNIHNRSEADIQAIVNKWEKTPNAQVPLDIRPLLQSDSITEVNMEDIDDDSQNKSEDKADTENAEKAKDDESQEDDIPASLFTSKWELMDFNDEKKDQLDGLRKKRAPENSIRDWLQNNSRSAEDAVFDTERRVSTTVPGKKRVRWADMEERHAVAKMRNLGFVVGQTDWNRMMDPDQADNKLTQIKYF